MTREKLDKILVEHSKWLVDNATGERANLRGADLTGADLTGADLTGANLKGANLTGAFFTGADLTRATLRGANLTGAFFTGADLTRADLRGADLTGADLTRANLTRANLTRANLTGANLEFSSWPLWCGSLNVKIDPRIARQLIYHFLRVLPEEDKKEFLANPYKYANGFHRAEDCGYLEEGGI